MATATASTASATRIKFEDILRLAGDAGRWQLIVFLWTVVGGVLTAFHSMSSVFIGAVPDYRCRLPWEETSADGSHFLLSNVTSADLAAWLPRDNATGTLNTCQRFVTAANVSDVVSDDVQLDQQLQSQAVIACDSFVFSRAQYQSTIVDEWQLVCQRLWLLSTVQASFMFGIFCGALASGVLSDQFGRKRAVAISGVAFFVSSITASFAGSYMTFVVLRFVTAMAGAGVFGCLFILCMELVGLRHRALIGMTYQISFAAGFASLPAVAYYARRWRHLQLAISLPSVMMLLFWWVIPESPRWLMINGRMDEALATLKFAAARNRRQLPDDDEMRRLMDKFRMAELGDTVVAESKKDAEECGLRQRCHRALIGCGNGACEITQLVRTPRLRRISLSSFFNWLVVSMIYYGVSFNSASLSSSPYLAIFLSGLVEIPAVLLAVPLINRVGRRLSVVGTHLCSGAAVLCILAVPASLAWPKLLLGLIGKFSASATFAILYLYSAELFPTQLRNIGFGASSTCARIGSMSAPYIVDLLSPIHWTIPSCVFGLCAVTAAVVAMLLPETNGRRLPETVEDVETDIWGAPKPQGLRAEKLAEMEL